MARKHTVRWAVYSVTCVFARLTAPLQTPFSALQVRTSENGGPQIENARVENGIHRRSEWYMSPSLWYGFSLEDRNHFH